MGTMSQPTLQQFKADLFKAMANPIRIRILEELRIGGGLTVGEIQQRVHVEPSNVSQHLSIMRSHRLVTSSREGTSVRYSITAPEIFHLMDVARKIFENQLLEHSRMLESSS
jgi:DNA-binding transcriptional ArsR family regulator